MSVAVAPTVILLVEDNLGDARLLQELLSEASTFAHSIVHASRLAEARAMLVDRHFDVVLLDLTLPDASGLEGLRRVHRELPRLPIVVLTGLSDEALAIEAVEAGAQDYLVKGEADPRTIVRSVRYAVQRSRAEEVARNLARTQQAHATASAERARLQVLFMQAPAGIAVMRGPALVIELANPLFLQLTGTDELIGHSIRDAIPRFAGHDFEALLRGVMEHGTAYVGKGLPCQHPAGDGFCDFVSEPMRGDDGVVEGVIVVATDVTDQVVAQRQAEAARRAAALSEQRFQILAEVIPQLVWSTSADGGDIYLSPRWYEYTGQSRTQLLTSGWRSALHPDDLEASRVLRSPSAEDQAAWQQELRLRRHDGVYRWHLVRSVPHCDRDGTILRWYGTATDIDEQRRAIRSRDDLLATVSHDLRNPLGTITLATEALRRHTRPDDERGARQLATISRSAQRMEQLIRDLLDMASIESGHLSISREAVPVRSLVEDAIEAATPLASAKLIELGAELLTSQVQVDVDRGRAMQVFANIIGNAVKFTPSGGRILVRASERDDGFVRFAIADTGPGIEPNELGFVFDRFWQAKETARAGTGLGLAICKGIIEGHDGTIWVESQVGLGTTFYFTLRRARAGA